VLATFVYENAFLKAKFGYATAAAMAMFALAFILSLITMFFTRRESLEY
jgi:ABC-type sugar transport system permease subunit